MALQEVPEKAGDQANVEDICTEESSHVDLALDQDLQLALRLLLQQQQQPSEQQQYRLLLLISLWILKNNSLGSDTARQCPQDANDPPCKPGDQANLEGAVFNANDTYPDHQEHVEHMKQAFSSQQRQMPKREQQQQRPHKHQHHLLLLCILGILRNKLLREASPAGHNPPKAISESGRLLQARTKF